MSLMCYDLDLQYCSAFEALYPCGLSIIIGSYVARAIRLKYAFDMRVSSKILEKLLSREYLLASIVFAISVIYGAALTYVMHLEPQNHFTASNANFQFYMNITVTCVEVCLLFFSVFLMRWVKKEYSFRNEYIFVSAVYFVFLNVNAGYLFYISYEYEANQPPGDSIYCLQAIQSPWIVVGMNSRNLLLAMVTIGYPLVQTSRGHFPLTPRRVFDGFRYFIMDELCVEVFNKYLFALSESSQDANKRYTHVMDCFLSLQTIFLRDDDEEISNEELQAIVVKYIETPAIAGYFPAQIVQEIRTKYHRGHRKFEMFDKLYTHCYHILEYYFMQHYNKTRSCEYLKTIFADNEKINSRLYTLNMLSICGNPY